MVVAEPSIGQSDRAEIEDYRSVSGLSVLTLFAGFLSFTALAHPLMWCLPPIVTVVGLFALRRIDRSAGSLTGSRLATAGVGLAVLAGSMAVSKIAIGERIQTRSAARVADQWLEMFRLGQDQLAHQWTLPTVLRAPETKSLAEVYQEEERATGFRTFIEGKGIKDLAELDDQAEYQFVKAVDVAGNNTRKYFTLEYRVSAPGSEFDDRPLHVVVSKRHDSDYKLDWWQADVANWADEEH